MAYGKVRVDQIQSSTRTVDVDNLATTAVATQSVAGLLSATDKTKLDGVAAGAEVNVNADWNAGSGDAQILNKPTIGTSANNLVQLDGSARLPAVDGSQLTGLVAATDLSYTASTRVIASSTGTDATLTLVTSTDAGLAPASGGGTTNFLRADGTFAAPPGGSPGGSTTQVQFNNAGAFGGDADLTWNSTTNVLGITGDVNLSDGGTYTTTLQTITPTADRTISLPNATGTVALVAGSSGQLLYNNAGVNAGASTLTYDSSILTTSGRFINSYNATASSPAKAFTGTWFTGGTGTTTKPQVLIEPTGATSTAWSTSGTGLGVNAASGFTGNLLDLQVNGTSQFKFSSTGNILARDTGSRIAQYCGPSDTSRGIRVDSGAIYFVGGNRDSIIVDTAGSSNGDIYLRDTHILNWSTGNSDANKTARLSVTCDAADTLAQRRGTNAQTFRVYNTYTSGTNYELGKLEWASNVFRIGTEKGSGGGTARALEFQTDGTTRLTITTAGTPQVQIKTQTTSFNDNILLTTTSNGIATIWDSNATDFGRLNFGGTTTSFPALKRSSAILQARLADDSAYTTIDAQHRLQGTAPASATATGTTGDIRFDADFIYICTATNTWKRAALTTW
jgi:hypothetical protein